MNPYHQHEVLHVSNILAEQFDRTIVDHPFTKADPELDAAATSISSAMHDFYQLVGSKEVVGV